VTLDAAVLGEAKGLRINIAQSAEAGSARAVRFCWMLRPTC
jgi:hypothetical protein